MLAVPGLPADRIRKLHEVLDIGSVAALEEAALSGRLAATKGFGPAFQAKVLQGLEMSRRPQSRHIHRAALALDQAISSLARTHPELGLRAPACGPIMIKMRAGGPRSRQGGGRANCGNCGNPWPAVS
jgi:DNA polymerase (family 10)